MSRTALRLSLLALIGFAAQAAEHKAVAILKTHCASCHGGPEPARYLDVTTREGVLKGGVRGPAVVVGDPLESILYRVIAHQHDIKMPPNKPRLPDEDIKVIKRWIEDGAPWEEEAKESAEKK
jgi:hypothetical protein